MLENIAGLMITNAFTNQNPIVESNNPPMTKKKRNLPGTPDPDAEVIALSPTTLMATNRFLCEICGKGFQRDQNLQLHRRGHNLPWKLRQRSSNEPRKRVYVCPEMSCVHHHPSRALGDLTGIKKHFCRKHGEKKWKCDKCSKRYAVQSDWKAHSKTCGTRDYRCDCGTLFSRRDSFITHRAFCDALTQETARITATSNTGSTPNIISYQHLVGTAPLSPNMQHFSSIFKPIFSSHNTNINTNNNATTQTNQPSFSLWNMDHGSQSCHHDLMMMMSSTAGSTLQDIHQHQYQHVGSSGGLAAIMYGSSADPLFASSCSNTGELISTAGATTESHIDNKEGSSLHITSSVPSLYSTQQQQQPIGASSVNMSATALLQKAAQIGATSSTADPSLMCYGGNFKDNSNEKYSLLFGPNPTLTGMRSDIHNEMINSSAHDYSLSMQYPSKIQKTHREDEIIGEQTRDFLGVGVQAINCSKSSINGWIVS
ncbi:hypothetical protein Sjap_025806 [Stephania japonica]|uniref:C2H2-type domain-containing protein n=1 Tax=Stephania japonica TaxID=461633 RepID=A0AAP0HJW2_9MAGN